MYPGRGAYQTGSREALGNLGIKEAGVGDSILRAAPAIGRGIMSGGRAVWRGLGSAARSVRDYITKSPARAPDPTRAEPHLPEHMLPSSTKTVPAAPKPSGASTILSPPNPSDEITALPKTVVSTPTASNAKTVVSPPTASNAKTVVSPPTASDAKTVVSPPTASNAKTDVKTTTAKKDTAEKQPWVNKRSIPAAWLTGGAVGVGLGVKRVWDNATNVGPRQSLLTDGTDTDTGTDTATEMSVSPGSVPAPDYGTTPDVRRTRNGAPNPFLDSEEPYYRYGPNPFNWPR